MTRSLKISILAGCIILLMFAIPSVSAFEISGEYTETGMKWLNEHWGENITLGDVAKIAYTPENLRLIEANVDPKLLEKIWSLPYFWGDRYPPDSGTPSSTTVSPDNNNRVSETDEITQGTLAKAPELQRVGGISVSADPTGYSGGYITYGGSGSVYGYTGLVDYFKVEAKLHGDGTWLQTSYNENYSYTNDPRVTLTTKGMRTPITGTLYQSQTVGQSTNPTNSANTWSTSYLY